MNSYARSAMIYLEEVKENRLYSFGVPIGAPYSEIYEMIESLKEQVQKMDKEAQERFEKDKTKENKEESDKAAEPVEVKVEVNK